MPLLYVLLELLDERRDMPGDGIGERVVLILEALPNGCQPFASIASRIYLALRGTGLNGMPTNPVVDPVGRLNRSGESWLPRCRHEGPSRSGSPLQADYGLIASFRAQWPNARAVSWGSAL